MPRKTNSTAASAARSTKRTRVVITIADVVLAQRQADAAQLDATAIMKAFDQRVRDLAESAKPVRKKKRAPWGSKKKAALSTYARVMNKVARRSKPSADVAKDTSKVKVAKPRRAVKRKVAKVNPFK